MEWFLLRIMTKIRAFGWLCLLPFALWGASQEPLPLLRAQPGEAAKTEGVAPAPSSAPLPVLKPSDVVFMYQAPAAVYKEYGATVLASGGAPTAESLTNAQGMKFFGSVGMVTEFARYYDRFPETYEEGLCRDLEGKPYKVPWLADHQHKGAPFWWCCTRQPLFRRYITERVVATLKAGAYGVHVDDHLGTAGSLWLGGGCFCGKCVEEFREDLKDAPAAGVEDPGEYDFAGELRGWLAEDKSRKAQGHPLWPRWRAYQLRGAARFMAQLRVLAAATADHSVPMSANAGLLWGDHLSDYQSLDFFSAEIDHQAAGLKFSGHPLAAYRIADAVGRPLAATAGGQDWAFIKERNLPGLVRGWIALGYAAGHSLMAPNRQWCHTKEKGTHWYDGPKEKFAPLYRFVRDNPELFDDYLPYADVTIAYAQKAFSRAPSRLIELCQELCATNIAYALAMGGDEVVSHPLDAGELRRARRLVVLDRPDFLEADERTLAGMETPTNRLAAAREALKVTPAVRAEGGARVLILPRVKPGSAVIHIINWDYDPEADSVRPLKALHVRVDYAALGVRDEPVIRSFAPGREPLDVNHSGGLLSLPQAGLWTVLHIE